MTCTVYSQEQDCIKAAKELASACTEKNPKLVLFFASASYDPSGISAAMKEHFPDACVIGCSTSGEIISGMMLKKSIVAMVLDETVVGDVSADVFPMDNPAQAGEILRKLSANFDSEPLSLDPSRYLGIILMDGLSCGEEQIMDRLGDLTNVPIIGGSAGDDLAFSKTWVYYEGLSFSGKGVLVLIKPSCKFDFIKTQSFCSFGKHLVPTKVDEASRTVLEFDGRPAALAYAEALGVQKTDLTGQFMSHPVGLMADGEPYVRSPQQVDGDAVTFYCQVRKGVDLEILSSKDIIVDTAAALTDMKKRVGTIKGLINFNCILRTLQLEQEGRSEAYGDLFADIPTIGFSTYGEAYIGHINQTATMLVFY